MWGIRGKNNSVSASKRQRCTAVLPHVCWGCCRLVSSTMEEPCWLSHWGNLKLPPAVWGWGLEIGHLCSFRQGWLCGSPITCERGSTASLIGVLALPLRSWMQKKVFDLHLFSFLRIAFLSEMTASSYPPLVSHLISCPRENVDSKSRIYLTKLVWTPRKVKSLL